MRVGEIETLTLSFRKRLGAGENIIGGSLVWNIAPVDGADASGMANGTPALNAPYASQSIKALRPGTYAMSATAQTDKGQTLTTPAPGDGLLQVVA
jgi:hypothetical protein